MSRSALDRPAARIAALGVALLAAGALGWIHRSDLWPAGTGGGAEAGPDLFRECVAARSGEIDKMLREGLVDPARAALFKTRAEALCRSEAAKAEVPSGRSSSSSLPARRFQGP